MKRIAIIITFIFLVLFPLSSSADNISKLIRKYHECEDTAICKKMEIKMIKHFLNETDILDILEEMPEDESIKYEILHASFENNECDDYAFRIVIDSLGYVVILVMDGNKYIQLPVIEKGYIYDFYLKDMTGDGKDELIFSGYGAGTGYSSEWSAIYKYRNKRMELIWSGLKEEKSEDQNEIKHITHGSIDIYNIPGKKSKEIQHSYCIAQISTKTYAELKKRCEDRIYLWSKDDFKFIVQDEK